MIHLILKSYPIIPTYAGKVRYCKRHLGFPIGNGSARIVFQLDDEKCLKLAKNRKGIAQNGAEYDSADDDSWIVTEYVLPAKQKDFKQCLGILFSYQK